MLNKSLFSSKSNEYETPIELFNQLDIKYHFTLDPCSTDLNCKCIKHYTKQDNGLLKSWKNEIVFCNPPYGRELYYWVKKCYEENLYNNTKIVLLIPSRTDTRYFHEFLYNNNNVDLIFLKGRLKFNNMDHGAPFPSLIAVFN